MNSAKSPTSELESIVHAMRLHANGPSHRMVSLSFSEESHTLLHS